MWSALLRNAVAGLRKPRGERPCRKPARRRLNVEALEDRQLLVSGTISWITGGATAAVAAAVVPAPEAVPEPLPPFVPEITAVFPSSPTEGEVVRFTLDAGHFSNTCYAERAYGGRPSLAFNEEARRIDVVFLPPAPQFCLDVYIPVDGLQGQLFDLTAGDWTLRGPLSSITFTVQPAQPAEPIPLEFTTIDQGEVSGYRFDDPTFTSQDLVIRDQETWQTFWTQHTSNVIPPPPLPEVNFQSQMVLATLLGRQSSGGGPRIDVEAVFLSPDGTVTVFVRDDRRPGPLDQITSPFHIVSVPLVAVDPVFVHRDVRPFETIDRGPISRLRYGDPDFTGMDLVIEDGTAWQEFWEQHTGDPTSPPPEIDFERQMVLVTLLGFQTTGGGPSTTIFDVLFDPADGTLTVRVLDDRTPGPLTVITNPFHFVVVDRVDFTSVVWEHYVVPGPATD